MNNLEKFYEYMKSGKIVDKQSGMLNIFNELSQEAIKITMEINSKYHTPDEIVKLFSKLIGKNVDSTFRLFPPFYTDCGKNISIGKNVFINACCKFQDQGGIQIGDGVLIGHNVTLATLNHEQNPNYRQNIIAKPIVIKDKVWIGSNATILQGVTIGEGAIVAANALITKDVPANTIVAGLPAKIIKEIDT